MEWPVLVRPLNWLEGKAEDSLTTVLLHRRKAGISIWSLPVLSGPDVLQGIQSAEQGGKDWSSGHTHSRTL